MGVVGWLSPGPGSPATMSTAHLATCVLIALLITAHCHDAPSPYLSPTTFHPNYQNMLRSFKIYAYTLPSTSTFNFTQPFSSLLLNSPFLTHNPEEAHLFFVPLPALPTRSLARAIRDLRSALPFWNRTLGADHFYLSASGLGFESDRNLVELKKNSVQLSPFPAPAGRFIPHKDLTLPPLAPPHAPLRRDNATVRRNLCYVMYGAVADASALVSEAGCLVESEPPEETAVAERLAGSAFCVFEYGGGDFTRLGQAMGSGCVPVVVTDRPMQDLPLIGVVRWEEMAVFVRRGAGVRSVLESACGDGACGRMRRMGVEASRHFAWNEPPSQYDAFYMVMYQLWLRRHTIRYARRDSL